MNLLSGDIGGDGLLIAKLGGKVLLVAKLGEEVLLMAKLGGKDSCYPIVFPRRVRLHEAVTTAIHGGTPRRINNVNPFS